MGRATSSNAVGMAAIIDAAARLPRETPRCHDGGSGTV